MNRSVEEANFIKLNDELLDEIFNGQYDNFRAYLQQNKITHLDLGEKVVGRALNHLGLALKGTDVTHVDLTYNQIASAKDFGQALQGTNVNTVYLGGNTISDQGAKDFGLALQGTNVSTVILCSNEISAQGAKDFGLALKGTKVTTVDLSGNKIDSDGAKDFADCIPGTLLIKADLGIESLELSQALELNRQKLLLTPYYMAALRLLPIKEQNKHANLGVDALDTLRYAGGILMYAPSNVANHILGFLPLMYSRQGISQTINFLGNAKKYHPDGLKVKENSNPNLSTVVSDTDVSP